MTLDSARNDISFFNRVPGRLPKCEECRSDFSYLYDMEIGKNIMSRQSRADSHIPSVDTFLKLVNPMMIALKERRRHLRKSTARRKARNVKIAEPQKPARDFVKFHFHCVGWWAVGEFIFKSMKHTKTEETKNPQPKRLLRKIWKRDGFVLMSGNEIVINYSKVKFVWFFFFIPLLSFLLISFCLFSKQSRKFMCWNFNANEAQWECTLMNPRVRLCIFRCSLKLFKLWWLF